MKSKFVKISKGSDFELLDKVQDIENIKTFEFNYYTTDITTAFTVSYADDEYVNCSPSSEGIVVHFDSPQFEPGCLRIQRKYVIYDDDFYDSTHDLIRVDKTNVYIVNSDKKTSSSAVYEGSNVANIADAQELADKLEEINNTSVEVENINNSITTIYTKLDDEYAKKSDIPATYDDTELRNRIIVLENKEDKDTIYDDSELRARIVSLENKPDNDTVYDDTELRNRINELENKPDNDTVYDDTELRNRINELENRPSSESYDDTELRNKINELENKEDKDTIYDDSELRNRINELENRPSSESYDDTNLTLSIAAVGAAAQSKCEELEQKINNIPVAESYDDTNLTLSIAAVGAAAQSKCEELEQKINNIPVAESYDDTELRSLISNKADRSEIPNTSKFLDKTSTGTNNLAGKIQIGDYTTNITNAILHIRNVGNSSITGAKVNGACYSVNGDGTATLQHKTYNDTGGGAKNAAVLRMSNKGLQFAVNTGTGASPSEDMYKNIATEEYVDKIGDKINDLQLYKFPNATIIGTPTINNGQISNFSTNNYLQFPFVVNFQNRPFEINMAFTTGNNVTTQENILDSNFGLAFAVANSHFVIALSSTGTNWNIGASVGTYTVQPNTAYYIKIKWNGIAYSVEYSLDNTEFIADINVQSNANLSPKQIIIGKSLDNRYVFGGIINFNYASLEISDKIVWSGMDDVGLATRLATDMSNIDEAGISKIKEIVDTSSFVSVEDYESLEESTANALKAHNDKFREYYKSTQIDTKLAAFANLNDIKNAVKEYSKLSKVEELEEVIAAVLCNLNERLLALE